MCLLFLPKKFVAISSPKTLKTTARLVYNLIRSFPQKAELSLKREAIYDKKFTEPYAG
jgi:hypothetical protein